MSYSYYSRNYFMPFISLAFASHPIEEAVWPHGTVPLLEGTLYPPCGVIGVEKQSLCHTGIESIRYHTCISVHVRSTVDRELLRLYEYRSSVTSTCCVHATTVPWTSLPSS